MSTAGPLGSSDAPTPASLIPLVASISPELESEKQNGQFATLQVFFWSQEQAPLKKKLLKD